MHKHTGWLVAPCCYYRDTRRNQYVLWAKLEPREFRGKYIDFADYDGAGSLGACHGVRLSALTPSTTKSNNHGEADIQVLQIASCPKLLSRGGNGRESDGASGRFSKPHSKVATALATDGSLRTWIPGCGEAITIRLEGEASYGIARKRP
jgi:hypothetical protein